MTAKNSENCQVMIVAGESSGDLHGSNLLKAAAESFPHLRFFGVGGERMANAGCRIIFPTEELSVMGLIEVLTQLPRIFVRYRQLKKVLEGDKRPDLLVLIDFPDFNLRLAKVAKKNGIPVLYYISPKVWAWRSGRAKTIAQRVDRLALIFPFEPEIYQSLGAKAEYVGNPLLDEFAENPPQGILRKQLNIDSADQVVGIFPGSRNSELKYIFASLLEAAQQIYKQKPEVKFLLPVAPSLSRQFFVDKLQSCRLPIEIVEENIYEVATACSAILTVSGTVTLQIALTATPMAIVYKVAPLSYQIGRRLITIEHAGLANIVAGREIVREFIQDKATPEAMSDEILRILDDHDYSARMRQELSEVKKTLGSPGCSQRVAEIVNEMINACEKIGQN